MKLLLDVHNHTVSSGHAYSTVQEVALEASKKGLKYVGITDHGPKMPGGPHIFHIGNLKVIPDNIDGVEILKGVEANILNKEGEMDIPERLLKGLDIVIASLHDVCMEPSNVEEHTKALLNAMENEYVDILGHPGNPSFPIDKEKVIKNIYIIICTVFAALKVLPSTGFDRIISLSLKSNNTEEKSEIRTVIIININIPNRKLI